MSVFTESSNPTTEGWIHGTARRSTPSNLIEYIILAEFDIDTGSTVRHQYPTSVVGHESDPFAEYMLPEGAHNREEDWTYMILDRDGPQIDEVFWLKSSASVAVSTPPTAAEKGGGRDMLFGINHVRTKYDSNVRRGAIVKAIMVLSKYHFVESFKDVLIEGLEMYYTNPCSEVLIAIYNAMNEVKLDQCPILNPAEQFFLKKRCLRSCLRAIEQGEYRPAPTPTMLPVTELSISIQPPPKEEGSSPAHPHNVFVPIPLAISQDEVGDINLTRLLKLFGESSMRIYDAIMSRKRVLFVGYNHAACDLAQMVFSAVAMCAPPIPGIIKRAVPYATLSDLSFLEIPGYIAGVTNPMFQQHDNWFDLLCILDVPNERGIVKSAEECKAEESQQKGKPYNLQPTTPAEVAIENMDSKFVARVISGSLANFGEQWIRLQFHEYTSSFVQEAMDLNFNKGLQGFEKYSEKYQKKYDIRYIRIAKLAASDNFKNIPMHPWSWLADNENGVPVDGNRVRRDIRRLTVEVELPGDIVLSSLDYLDHTMICEKALQALICMLSDSAGGLTALSVAIFHPYSKVRDRVASIFQKLKSFESTAYVFDDLNPFFMIAFQNHLENDDFL